MTTQVTIPAGERSIGVTGPVSPRGLTRQCRAFEDKGYRAIWWPDHLQGWLPRSVWEPDLIPLAAAWPNPDVLVDPLVAMGAAAEATARIGLGTGVTDLVRRHPAVVAQAALTAHHLSGGRAILGVGAGERANLSPYGMPSDRLLSRLEEAVAVVRLLWESDDLVGYEGEYVRLDDAVLGLGPYEGSYPQLWVGGLGPKIVGLAGRVADGWLPVYAPLETYRERRRDLETAARAQGRDPETIRRGMLVFGLVGEDHEESHRLLDTLAVRSFAAFQLPPAQASEIDVGYHTWVPHATGREDVLARAERLPFDTLHAQVPHGDPDELAQHLATYAAEGLEHLVLLNIGFFADPRRASRLFDLADAAGYAFLRAKVAR